VVSVVEWLAQQNGLASQEGRYFLGWALCWPPYRGAEASVAAGSLPESALSGVCHIGDPSMGGRRHKISAMAKETATVHSLRPRPSDGE